jgi:hypothetical protein
LTTNAKDFKVKNGLVAGSTIIAPASTTAIPSFRLPHGTAPTAPTDGDMWTTTAGVYARVNGATVGPLGAGGGGGDVYLANNNTFTNSASWVSSASYQPQLAIQNTNIDGTAGYINFQKNPTDNTLANGDYIGTFVFQAPQGNSPFTLYNAANFAGQVISQGATFVEADIQFTVTDNVGTTAEALRLSGTSGATFTGKVSGPASTTARATFNLPHGTAPTSPINGDMWTTTNGVYVQVNGVTEGPLAEYGPRGYSEMLGYTTTPTAGATTTLTNTSTTYQTFTGTLAQTIVLPVTSTLKTGWTFEIDNNSTLALTVNSSGGNLVKVIPSLMSAVFTCVGTTLATAADWDAAFNEFVNTTGTGSTVVFSTSPTITTPTIDTINAGTATTAVSLYPNVTTSTGSISIGAGLTTGALQLATVGTGVTPITIGHTNATIGITGNTTITGTLTLSSDIVHSAATGAANIFAAKTTGSIVIGSGIITGGSIQIGGTAVGSVGTLNIFTGATTSGTKAINIGTGGSTGSTTTIVIGTTGGTTPTITLNGTVTAATPANGSNTTTVATTAFVQSAAANILPYQRQGTLAVAAGVTRFRFPVAVTIVGISMACNTAPTGAAILTDINKNGTTIFTTQGNRPTIAVSAFNTAAEVTNMDVTAFAAGDYLTVDIDQIGSTVAGADLTVAIRYRTA